jgi:hypothetical protein
VSERKVCTARAYSSIGPVRICFSDVISSMTGTVAAHRSRYSGPDKTSSFSDALLPESGSSMQNKIKNMI